MIHRLTPTTERARLTTLYGCLLLVAGIVLVTVIYVLLQLGLDGRVSDAITHREGTPTEPGTPPPADLIPSEEAGRFAQTETVQAVTATALSRLLVVSAIAFVVYAALSLFLAWWMAGRVLRPVGVISATARKLSGENLHQRIDLKGPPGELKDLADTFDQMLGRLEQLVTAQRRFAANAAHELRTPVAVQRAAAEIGLADPDPERVEWIRRELLETADASEHLIESLLLLATTEQGLTRREPVAFQETVALVCADFSETARAREVDFVLELEPMTILGDAVLLRHLVRNLVANALAYNKSGGHVRVRLADRALVVSNTGPQVPGEALPTLFDPFHRLKERTYNPGEGAGLGLTLVASIAQAHDARATAHANPGGGLTLTVQFTDDPMTPPTGRDTTPGTRAEDTGGEP